MVLKGLGVDGRRKQHFRQFQHILDLLRGRLHLHISIPRQLSTCITFEAGGRSQAQAEVLLQDLLMPWLRPRDGLHGKELHLGHTAANFSTEQPCTLNMKSEYQSGSSLELRFLQPMGLRNRFGEPLENL